MRPARRPRTRRARARENHLGVDCPLEAIYGPSARAYWITLPSLDVRSDRARRAFAWVLGTVAFLVVVQLLWGPPAGIVVQGAILGGLSALLALGLALVYRANRILNFAQGDLGAAPASLAVLLVVTSGASWVVAFVVGIAAAVVLGAAVELLVIRRFFRSPRLILTVATIGLAQLLAGLGLLLPGWFGVGLPPQSFPAPFDLSFTVDPLTFGGNDVVALVVIPLAFVGLALFLRTRLGVAMRACADDADRAALLGIPVRRVHSVVWMLASLLAFLAVFLRAGIVGLSLGTVLGPSLLLPALAAAVIGRMERLPTIAFAAVALGIVEQAVVWGWNEPNDVQPVLFVVVLVAVWLTPPGAGLRGRLEPSTWRAVREPRPVPRELAGLPEVRVAGVALVAADRGRAGARPGGVLGEPHQPRRGRARVRRHRAVAGGADGLGGRDQSGPDGVRGGRCRGRCLDHRPPRVGPRLRAARRRSRRRCGGDAHRAPRAPAARAHPRRRHPRVRVGHHHVVVEPSHLRRGDPLRLVAAAARRTTGSVRDHSRAVGRRLLPALPRRPRARGDRGGRYPAQPDRARARSRSGRTSAPRPRSA